MHNPVSIFIMDVSNSTKNNNWDDISAYLDEWENWIKVWIAPIGKGIVKHRRGDEIIFIAQHYVTAYTIATLVKQFWKYPDQPPYFGISFGNVDREIDIIDVETWNHPLIKRAREANEKIKQSKKHTSILFKLDWDFLYNSSDSIFGESNKETENLMNLMIEMEDNLLKNQSKLQKLIYDLYFIYGQQKRVAALLNKSAATISSHYKKGNGELIFKAHKQIHQNINAFEVVTSKDHLEQYTKNMSDSIKSIISERLYEFKIIP
ncbi:hypothetical protein [Evansella cellulosilytica]|uniref:Uncharacterized protein n=1 Tax=Evansella cellulosilytica (strain ATCC 21833 / DSM 2522 / FERM P-1141 / JCM 9156 / N-4) TaxID=649639 RepID=E6TQA5_EVAC2|nr:hypothetical protein [Evansella cellulosilytica]ADU29283.1 hypothetical protein Bcell_1010 [Evansella cellulosilytica DSM 2522]